MFTITPLEHLLIRTEHKIQLKLIGISLVWHVYGHHIPQVFEKRSCGEHECVYQITKVVETIDIEQLM